jgi:mono/diheme cytochrome c family protein
MLSIAVMFVWIAVATHAEQPPHTTISQAARSGQHIFAQSCASCHDAHTSSSLIGPGLKGYYSTYQPKPTDSTVRTIIAKGKGKMPPFNNLSRAQTDDLIAYLKTL